MTLTQKNRQFQVLTPLGEDQLVLVGISGQEEMSRLFRFQLDLISDNNGVKAADIVGQNITFSWELPDQSRRFFNGFVSRFAAGDEEDGRRTYRAEVVPWLWFLTQTADCRLFQKKKIPDIIEKVFSELGFNDFEFNLKLNHKEWEYCVQYRESDFNFVSRLMEQEGIFYFFKHENGKHTLVLADHKSAYVDCVESEIDYPPNFGQQMVKDHLTSWEQRFEFCTGKWAQTDYNFETPSTNLGTNTNSVVPLPGIDKYEVFDFPGEYGKKSDGEVETKVRMEEIETGHNLVYATSGCRSLIPGGKFKVGTHRSSSEEGKSYVVTLVRHEAREPLAYESGSGEEASDYRNTIQCIPDSVVFRPARSTTKPIVHGVQTAVVVGPPGEEIHTDKYGRVRVHFHWDREHSDEEDSSCWIRVSQGHAGSGFGAIYIPRVGEEVVVAFLEGDPDRPLIVGRVYNANKMSAFGLPDSKVVCGMKSKTYKGSGYNEYVMDDSPGKELIREHGQFDKDSTIEHDLREHVLNCRTRDVTVDETITVGGNRTESVGKNESLTVGSNKTIQIGVNHTETIGSNMTINVGSNLTETVGMNYTETVGIAMTVTVGATLTQSVGATYTLSVGSGMTTTVGGTQKTSIGGSRKEQVGAKVTEKVGGNVTQQIGGKHQEKVAGKYKLKSGADIELQAASKIVLKTGASSITMTSGGDIKIKGTKITIEGAAKVLTKSAQISSEATAKNTVKGAMVNVEASAIANIKGSLVKIN